MRLRFISKITATFFLIFSFTVAANATNAGGIKSVTGLWKTHDGGLVRFYACGAQLCGKLLKTSSGQKKDKHNSNPKLRNRPIRGLTIIRSNKKSGPLKWHGTVYNVKDGQTYRGSLKMTSARKAKLTGCMAGGLCQSTTWYKISNTRVAGK